MSADPPPPPPVPPDPALTNSPSNAPAQPDRKGRGCLIAWLAGAALLVLLILATSLPAGGPRRRRKSEQARTLAKSLVNSCKGYYAEYSRYPLSQDGTAGEVSPLRTDESLTGTLLGTDIETNPKKISFLPELKPVERGGGFGLLIEGAGAMVVDPWGEEYYILMDTDYSGTIENPNAGSTTRTLKIGVIIWSAGPDKDPSTWEDNVMSWDSGQSGRSAAVPKGTR
jgi:hypothetical protein